MGGQHQLGIFIYVARIRIKAAVLSAVSSPAVHGVKYSVAAQLRWLVKARAGYSSLHRERARLFAQADRCPSSCSWPISFNRRISSQVLDARTV